MTRHAAELKPGAAWPEHPRPTLRRETWRSLNGLWDYAITEAGAPMPEQRDGQILVPFPIESSLSGAGRSLGPGQRLWYRRSFDLPDEWRGERILLRFEAVDHEAEVFVDGARLGSHRGGYDPFSFDATSALRESGPHVVVVGVRDPTDDGAQPRGKQVRRPGGIWYTASSGIWQTVWLEAVPETRIESFEAEAGPGRSLRCRIRVENAREGDRWRLLGSGVEGLPRTADVGAPISFDADSDWSPRHARLFDLEVALLRDGREIDRVRTYAARRVLSVGADARGLARLRLNGETLFQFGPLDQGFWPDGLYTPSSLAAVRADLDAVQAMGCNMLRKHVKVESELFYRECDERGILVWQDIPSGDCAKDPPGFERELRALIEARRRHPSIVLWVVFNEGWGQHDTRRYVDLVRRLDPTRWVCGASGWVDEHCGDVVDLHSYPGPAMPPREKQRASVLGEFGGLGLPVEGHTFAAEGNWGYVSFRDRSALTAAYLERLALLRPLRARGLDAAVYTQLTDVEVECNGWLTYDREILKIDAGRARRAAEDLMGAAGTLVPLVGTALDGEQVWRWADRDPGPGFERPDYDDSGWKQGNAGFGAEGTPGARVGTAWSTSCIWLRRRFRLDARPRDPFWFVHHDEDAEVWIDGQRCAAFSGYTTGYRYESIDEGAMALLTAGEHVLAARCRQTKGGQFIDIGIHDVRR
ncbi:MAG: glycoside hydrolase family 2 TIM barrel-domain containing protein [Planctomycetota bacterium]